MKAVAIAAPCVVTQELARSPRSMMLTVMGEACVDATEECMSFKRPRNSPRKRRELAACHHR